MAKRTLWRVMIVKLRMWYADIRGHHGHKWNYEPSEHYMGMGKKRKQSCFSSAGRATDL